MVLVGQELRVKGSWPPSHTAGRGDVRFALEVSRDDSDSNGGVTIQR